MKRQFDPESIKKELENLREDRARIEQTIQALEMALRSADGLAPNQKEFTFNPSGSKGGITLLDAVKKTCIAMADGITRQRVIMSLEREFPYLHPVSSSVSAALINLSKGDNPTLILGVEGKGRSPSSYSTQGDTSIKLTAEESGVLMDKAAVKGIGGWQSLWSSLQKRYDKASGMLKLTPELRCRLYQYFHSYGTGGWQNRVRQVFRREMPHLFES